jgi:hypothetical protein
MVFFLVLRLRVARYLRNHLCTLVCTFDLRNLAYFIVQDRLSCPLNPLGPCDLRKPLHFETQGRSVSS